jgi:hypothetical protein
MQKWAPPPKLSGPPSPRCVDIQDPVHALNEDGVIPPAGKALLEGGLVGDQEARVTQYRVDVVVADNEHVLAVVVAFITVLRPEAGSH